MGERGSARNQRYALTDAEADEYLTFEADGVNLRTNYLEVISVVLAQLKAGISARRLFGEIDEPKLSSSIKLFERLTRQTEDGELHAILLEVQTLLDGDLHDASASLALQQEPEGQNLNLKHCRVLTISKNSLVA